jgi:hypothetical protein
MTSRIRALADGTWDTLYVALVTHWHLQIPDFGSRKLDQKTSTFTTPINLTPIRPIRK